MKGIIPLKSSLTRVEDRVVRMTVDPGSIDAVIGRCESDLALTSFVVGLLTRQGLT